MCSTSNCPCKELAASGCLLSVPEGLSPGLRGCSWSPEREQQVHHGRQQHDAAGLVHRGEGNGDQVQKSGDAESDLDVCHRKRGSDHPLRQWGQGRAKYRVPSRQIQRRSCSVGGDSLITQRQRRGRP